MESTKQTTALCIKLLLTGGGILLSGFVLLVGVYMLPTARMKAHIAESNELFNYEGNYPVIIWDISSTQLDNYTDALMYASAIHPGSGNAIQDAMNNVHFEYYEEPGMAQSLNDYANDVSEKEPLRYEIGYSRYWHGYLIILKPILLLLNVSEIRMFNMLMQTILIFLLLYMILKKFGAHYTIPLIMAILVLNPVALPLSLQFSWVYYISLIGSIILLTLKFPSESNNYLVLFMAIGMMTSYFDLLTYPLITLGVPLVMWLLTAEKLKPLKRITTTVLASLLWLGGYAVMWSGKWFFAFLVGHKADMFTEVSKQISLRTSMVNDEQVPFTLGIVMQKLMSVVFNKIYVVMFIGFFIGCYLWSVYERRKHGTKFKSIQKDTLLHVLPYAIVALMPFVWFVVLSNHTREHYYFTYRELAVTVFAAGTAVVEYFVYQNKSQLY